MDQPNNSVLVRIPHTELAGSAISSFPSTSDLK